MRKTSSPSLYLKRKRELEKNLEKVQGVFLMPVMIANPSPSSSLEIVGHLSVAVYDIIKCQILLACTSGFQRYFCCLQVIQILDYCTY